MNGRDSFLLRYMANSKYLNMVSDFFHGTTIRRLSRKTNTDYKHLHKVMREAFCEGYINREKTPENDMRLTLTKTKGKYLYIWAQLGKLLDQWPEDAQMRINKLLEGLHGTTPSGNEA